MALQWVGLVTFSRASFSAVFDSHAAHLCCLEPEQHWNKDAESYCLLRGSVNVSNPKPALDRIKALEKNASAYLETARNEPILANGVDTIEQYFSFSDHIGNGTLKRKLREKLGMDI
jgi:hypothetical protein